MSAIDTVHYLPYNAINEFMRDDYRREIIQKVLSEATSLSSELREPIDRHTRQIVQVPGFRNSAKAPVRLRLKSSIEAFMTNAEFTQAILAAWVSLHPGLEKQVSELLIERGWEVTTNLKSKDRPPGFLMTWPDGEDFESILHAYEEKFIENNSNSDDINLMVVWTGGALPYRTGEEEIPEE